MFTKPFLALLAVMAAGPLALGQPFGGPFAPMPIPDGIGGCDGAMPGAIVAVLVPSAPAAPPDVITDVDITVGFGPPVHTWYGDVHLVVTHAGVSVTLMASPGATCGDSSDLMGVYTFDDGAAMTFDAAAAAAAGAAVVPPGAYIGDAPLAAFIGLPACGAWEFCIWDDAAGDIGTFSGAGGVITPAFGPSPWTFSITQCRAGAALFVQNTGGIPFGTYLNAVALAPGLTPAGWLLGLDIPIGILLAETAIGAPFFGVLDACGAAETIIPGVPPGIPLFYISLLFAPGGGPWVPPPSPPVLGGGFYLTI